MNSDRFHNQLALSIGYKLINDKRFTLEVEDSDDPWLTLEVKGFDDVRFKASCNNEVISFIDSFEFKSELKTIVDATPEAYINANKAF